MRQDGSMPHDDLLASLKEVPESSSRDAYLRFVNSAGDAALRRDGGPEHVTGSCFVFSPAFDRVLLCFHRKGQFWVQFGGHIESKDASVAETAEGAAREESGIVDVVLLSTAIVDLDRHDCSRDSLHRPLGCWIRATVDPDAEIAVSDESDDVRCPDRRTARSGASRLRRALGTRPAQGNLINWLRSRRQQSCQAQP